MNSVNFGDNFLDISEFRDFGKSQVWPDFGQSGEILKVYRQHFEGLIWTFIGKHFKLDNGQIFIVLKDQILSN